jgi:hypothetical protein
MCVWYSVFGSQVSSKEYWFMSANRFCGPCFSNKRGSPFAGKGFPDVEGQRDTLDYLREIQNQARGDIFTEISMAKAAQVIPIHGTFY